MKTKILALLMACPLILNAKTIYVKNLKDSGNGSLREAVAKAGTTTEDDTIIFDVSGKVVLSSPIEIKNEWKSGGYRSFFGDITISGAHKSVTLSGGGSNRILHVINTGVELKNLRFESGFDSKGGAIKDECYNGESRFLPLSAGKTNLCLEGHPLKLSNITFENNESFEEGGAIYSERDIEFHDAVQFNRNHARREGGALFSKRPINIGGADIFFQDNSSDEHGGAIYLSRVPTTYLENFSMIGNMALDDNKDGGAIHSTGRVMLKDSILSANSASRNGGAIAANRVQLENTTITGNEAYNNGGGLYVNGSLQVYDSNIFANSAITGNGGGVWISSNNESVYNNFKRSSFFQNESNNLGGGMYYIGDSPFKIENTTFSSNFSVNEGAALYVVSPEYYYFSPHFKENYLHHVTIYKNSSTSDYAGFYHEPSSSGYFRETVVWNSYIAMNSLFDCSSEVTTQGNNLFGKDTASTCNVVASYSVDKYKNESLDSGKYLANGTLGFPPRSTSRDISKAATINCFTTEDQSGKTRGAPCSIGAVD